MKILHVIPSLSPEWGRPTDALINFVYHLRQVGVEAEVITTNDSFSSPEICLEKWTEYQGIPVCFFPCTLRFKAFAPSLSLNSWLQNRLSDYELVHIHYLFSYAPTVAAQLARQNCIPYIVRTIGQLTPWALAQSRLRKKVYTHFIERKNLNYAAAIHCTTIGEAQDVTHFGIQTPKLILPLGVSPQETLPNAPQQLHQTYHIPDDRLILLFLSRLHYKKRIDLLLEALSKLPSDLPPTHLILAGSGDPDYCRYLQTCVEKARLTHQVTFTGFVTGHQKALLLQGADLFVLPSFSENFGIAVAEAMLAGLPTIITEGIQLSPDVQQAQAGLVIQSDLDSLRSALEKLIRSPELRKTLGANAQKLAQTKYHWPTITQSLIQAYQQILSGEFKGNFFQPVE